MKTQLKEHLDQLSRAMAVVLCVPAYPWVSNKITAESNEHLRFILRLLSNLVEEDWRNWRQNPGAQKRRSSMGVTRPNRRKVRSFSDNPVVFSVALPISRRRGFAGQLPGQIAVFDAVRLIGRGA
jgi:hypothetical protein